MFYQVDKSTILSDITLWYMIVLDRIYILSLRVYMRPSTVYGNTLWPQILSSFVCFIPSTAFV